MSIALDSAADLIRQVEGKTTCARVRYRLCSVGTTMTAAGLGENLGVSPREALFALDALAAQGLVERRPDEGPRPLYRWVGEQSSPAAMLRAESTFNQRMQDAGAPAPKPPPAKVEAPAPDAVKAAAHAALARASSAANKREARPAPGHRARDRILALFSPGRQISRASILAGLADANPGTVMTTISLLRRAGDIVETSSGQYRLRGSPADPAAAPNPTPPPAPLPATSPSLSWSPQAAGPTTLQLLEQAKAEPAREARGSLDHLIPVTHELLGKKFGYKAIAKWYADRGLKVSIDVLRRHRKSWQARKAA